MAEPIRRGEEEIRSLSEAALTQLNLPKNVAKGKWQNCSMATLTKKLFEEAEELTNEVRYYIARPSQENRQRVREEAGDVVAVVMMLADKCGALEPKKEVVKNDQRVGSN